MKLTAELSLYPLDREYIPVIKDFIDRLQQYGDLEIVTNAMSTQVCGDFDQVFTAVRRELEANFERHGKQVLVCKFIPGELAIRG